MGRLRRGIGVAVGAIAAAAVASRLGRRAGTMSDSPVVGTPARYDWRHAEIFYTRRGDGPTAVLVHDVRSGASGAEMATLGDALCDDFTIFTIDLPGFGRSSRPPMRSDAAFYVEALVELVRHEIGQPALIVASGVVGPIAAEAAARLGANAMGIVLLAPPERPSPAADPAARFYRAIAPVVGFGGPVAARRRGDLDLDARTALGALDVPILLVWGAEAEADPTAPEAYAAIDADLAQRVVPGTRTRPHEDDAAVVAETIRDWWIDSGRSA